MGIRTIQRYEVSCYFCGHTVEVEGYCLEYPHHPKGWGWLSVIRKDLYPGYYGDHVYMHKLLCPTCRKEALEKTKPSSIG